MVSIARKNLLEDLPRFLVAQAGIMFAVSLVTIQTGIFKGFTRSTVLLIEESSADIWVTSERMVNFEQTEPILVAQLAQAREVDGVERAEALLLGSSRWQLASGETVPVKFVGFDPAGQLFEPGKVAQGELSALAKPYNVMVDRSRLSSLEKQLGEIGTVNSFPAQIAAITEESQSIVTSSFLFTSLENANAYLNAGLSVELNCQVPSDGNAQDFRCTRVYEKADVEQLAAPTPEALNLTDPITYVLVKAAPGENIEALQRRLESRLPGVRAYTRAEMAQKTREYWEGRTGIGLILGLGATVGVIVGMVVVTQILYASVTDHIKEFGTLKAMGAPDRLLYGVVMEQAVWMAVLGYIPGMLLCLGVQSWIATEGIIILITPAAAAGVLGLVIVMCVGSGFLAIKKVTRLDPAIVFKA
ncbi:MAG: FtsX-like permease family protein [Cyanophyceae cyanobacterium]